MWNASHCKNRLEDSFPRNGMLRVFSVLPEFFGLFPKEARIHNSTNSLRREKYAEKGPAVIGATCLTSVLLLSGCGLFQSDKAPEEIDPPQDVTYVNDEAGPIQIQQRPKNRK